MKPMAVAAALFAAAGCAHGEAARAAPRPQEPAASIPAPRVHFATGRDALSAGERSRIARNARWLQEHPRALVVLEGHADERGSDAMNLALGDRRARSVKAALVSVGAGGEDRIAVVSAGEREPLDRRHREAAWKKNRRVEFIVP